MSGSDTSPAECTDENITSTMQNALAVLNGPRSFQHAHKRSGLSAHVKSLEARLTSGKAQTVNLAAQVSHLHREPWIGGNSQVLQEVWTSLFNLAGVVGAECVGDRVQQSEGDWPASVLGQLADLSESVGHLQVKFDLKVGEVRREAATTQDEVLARLLALEEGYKAMGASQASTPTKGASLGVVEGKVHKGDPLNPSDSWRATALTEH